MKNLYHVLVCCLVCTVLFPSQAISQAEQKTASDKVNSSEDLAPYPFDDKAPEKTFGEKIKESIKGELEQPNNIPKAEQPEEDIRFYEFKDITFDNDEMEFETEDYEAGPLDEYKMNDDENAQKEAYYKDVTFDKEHKIKENIKYDDELYSPHQKRKNAEPENKLEYKKAGEPINPEIEKPKTPQRSVKPIKINNTDFYRKDYIYYYYNRKKKTSGDTSASPDYYTAADRCRNLFKEDKKSVGTIYQNQLKEADEYFSYEIHHAEDLDKKNKLEAASEKTKVIIKKVYDEEIRNLQGSFDRAVEALDKKFHGSNQSNRNINGGRTKRGD